MPVLARPEPTARWLLPLLTLGGIAACTSSQSAADTDSGDDDGSTTTQITGPDEGSTGGEDLPEAGLVVTSTFAQPSAGNTVCEYGNSWHLHSQHGQNVSVVPQRQYVAACEDETGPRMFVSTPIDDGSGARTQLVYEARLNAATSTFELVGDELHLSECEDASGLAATPDCSALGILCQRPYGSSASDLPDADLITPYSQGAMGERQWPLRGDNAANADTNTEMWLYEYEAADLGAAPTRLLVHKAVRATETARPQGQYYLTYSPPDDAYAMATRSSIFTDAGARHTADAFLIINRGASPSEFTIDPARGYAWACGRGHTYVNHPGYNRYANEFAIACRTDIDGGMYFRTAAMGDPDEPFHRASFNGQGGNVIGGGPTTFVGLENGDFLLALVGNPAEEVGVDDWMEGPPTRIGLARFDANGVSRGPVDWVVSDSEHFLGHAQIAQLGENRYLLGWSRQWKIGDGLDEENIWTIRRRHSFQSAWAWYVVEIDGDGTPLTEVRRLEGSGWGDLDEWVELGEGRVGWAHIADPEMSAWDAAPNCDAGSLRALSVYTAE